MFWPSNFNLSINVFSIFAILTVCVTVLLAAVGEWAGSAASAALFAAFVALYHANSTEQRIASQAALEAYTYLVRSSVDECWEGKVERAHWNMIARTLASAEELESQITYLPHRRAMEAEKTIAKHRLLERLEKLPEGSYWGVGEPNGRSVNDLAKASTQRGGCEYVSEASLVRIYRFAEFDESYQETDPLNDQRFSDNELKRMNILLGGIYRYVKLHRENLVIGGALKPRD